MPSNTDVLEFLGRFIFLLRNNFAQEQLWENMKINISDTSWNKRCQYFFLELSYPSDEVNTAPCGKIISPTAGTITGTKVKVTAETKNLEVGQYVWLVGDKPDIGLCYRSIFCG